MNVPPLTGRIPASCLPVARRILAATPVSRPPRSTAIAWALIVIVAGMFASGLWIPGGWKLLVVTAGLLLFFVVLGRGVVDRALGILVNERNLMSLSRLQLVTWTLVILASYLCFALARIRAGVPNPLEVTIDGQLLLMMGISGTSFVAAPVILGTKKDQEPDAAAMMKTALKSGESEDEVDCNREGTLYGNSTVADARFTDVFEGDEVGNTMHIDVAKLQLFFFTLIGALAYLASAFHELAVYVSGTGTDLGSLPVLPSGLVVAFGISHAGYLGSKGISHTPVQN